VLALGRVVVAVGSMVPSRTVRAGYFAAIGWLTSVGFSRPPYGQMRPVRAAGLCTQSW